MKNALIIIIHLDDHALCVFAPVTSLKELSDTDRKVHSHYCKQFLRTFCMIEQGLRQDNIPQSILLSVVKYHRVDGLWSHTIIMIVSQ